MHQFRRIFAYLCACAVVAGLAGCGDSGPKRYAVSGEVKWRGKPLDQARQAVLDKYGRYVRDVDISASFLNFTQNQVPDDPARIEVLPATGGR